MARKTKLISNMATIKQHAVASHNVERCMVAPSPELAERTKRELERLRGRAKGRLARILRAKERTPIGMNDGLIYPGDYFPVGTPARVVQSAAANRAPLTGTVRVIVVLVEFSDQAIGETTQHYEDLFFSVGTLPNGSVRDYYREVTNNIIDIQGEVVGPYTLPLTLAQYANGASGIGAALPNARTMARDAADAANPDVDFGPYDNDGDGFVDAFVVVHAGAGAESTGDVNDIWSHKWVFSGGAYNADGTKIFGYLTVPEEARIGVCCHELGHLLFGFPDLYDTDSSGEGIGNWCLMAGGSWNGGGDIPAHPSAWCKANQGWVTVTNQTNNALINIADVKTSHTVYRLWKDGSSGSEYFLVENRQKSLYDQMLPGDGLLIWHVDESIPGNSDENHPKVALEQADGNRDLENGNNRGDTGDSYPGSSNNSNFNNSSTPNSKSYAGVDTCVAVSNIGPSGPVMSAFLAVKCSTKSLLKDFKDLTKDKFEKEKERKELFKEKLEKDRKEPLKEKREKEKDWKEFGKDKFEKEKDKDILEGKDLTDKLSDKFTDGGWDFENWRQGQAGQLPGDIEARIAALEARLASITPFIDASLRPDLREGALSSEEDIDQIRSKVHQQTVNAKRVYDTKQRDY